MLAVYICIGFSLSTLLVSNWVSFEVNGDDERKGSLFTIDEFTTGTDEIDRYGYDCISVAACDADSDSTNCETFDPLWEAGDAYLI
jgi:hypothetical protein